MCPARPDQAARRAGLRAPQRRDRGPRPPLRGRRTALLAPAALVVTCTWSLVTSRTDAFDAGVLALEVAATAAPVGCALLTRTAHARRALLLLSAYFGLTLLGDGYWLLSVAPGGPDYTAGEVEPGFTVATQIVRYLALVLLVHLAVPPGPGPGGRAAPPSARAADAAPTPRAGRGRRTGRGGPDRSSALVLLQAGASTAAVVLLVTPVGTIVAEGKSYSVYSFFDLVVTAVAAAVVGRALAAPARPPRRQLRQLVATATGVVGLVLGDALTAVGLARASSPGWTAGVVFAVTGAVVVMVTWLHPAPRPTGPESALPPPPVRSHPRLGVTAAVVVQLVLPVVITVLATAHVVTAQRGGGDEVQAATVGTAAAAVALSLLHAGLRLVRAHRDEQHAAAAGRDELTGAYTRRGFTAFALRHLHEHHHPAGRHPAPGGHPRAGLVPAQAGPAPTDGWSVALLDLDGFKAVNDTFGHDAGDTVLRVVAQRAAEVIDGHGILARFGGDEFVALLDTGPPASTSTRQLLHRLEEAVTGPITLQGSGEDITVGVSIGVAAVLPPGRGEDVSAALKQADDGMYRQKRRHHP
ncbi:diguanylate cyclase [Kineococcus sp. TBRC 1896]|uniref:Diguanylate cyclase n=1 Tax=Kineococcus mangrovi TaxID=1660183 RepID=A0ABV4I1M0_9ACTN